ncbi:VOC family protein [Micromonospora sp. NPDC049049]|uniref:VOC family protein n=1 Tax=Micromonospora sp. NPDC049049 TaxID=3155495 RepID=UPI0033F6A7EE
MLDGEVAVQTPDFCAVKAGPLHLGAVRVDGYRPPTWPSGERSQQIHFDLAVDEPDDLDDAEARAIELGAVKEEQQPAPDAFASRVIRPAIPSAYAADPHDRGVRVSCPSSWVHRVSAT